MGTARGMFRMYPGSPIAEGFDPTNRPWYKRAKINPSVQSISTPYVDAAGAGVIVTMSKPIIPVNGFSKIEVRFVDRVDGALNIRKCVDKIKSLLEGRL